MRHLTLANPVPRTQDVGAFYRVAASGAEILLPLQRITRCMPFTPAELDTPDLSALGATLCIRVEEGRAVAERCAEPSELRVLPEARPAPALAPLAATWGLHQLVGRATPFAWARHEGAIARLELAAHDSSAETPTFIVYTDGSSEPWPELGAEGASFPADFVTYGAEVTELAPYASVDAALGPDGIGAAPRNERFHSTSRSLRILTTPTGGPPPECDTSSPLSCDPLPPITEDPCEGRRRRWHLRLDQINRKLSLHPRLAAAFGKACARDCADVHAFEAIYREFAQRHPRFEANDPLRMPPALPPMPDPAVP
jgi:hypothetical protein